MKVAINSQLVLCLCLFSFVGVRAVQAAEPIGDGQEQARLMLSGRSFQVNDTKYRTVVSRSEASNSVAVDDAQEQGREMILGRPAERASGMRVEAYGSRAAGAPVVEEDALEMARRMILGSHSKPNSTKARLARKVSRTQEAQ